ncbi:glycoside hydrolase family 19 protein [Pseudomonas sp. BF-R-30]|uniref:glycoside hydrolase family 19 protein n=1 Tax=Pseudomonas sp. BF-R-30 TaxID=2832384 RepID=UPI001CBCD485|nr:glycoside hydrolase family 19 protein [Pseudomonas sp. BF-R-30]
MLITRQQLLLILPNARSVAGVFVPALNAAMARYRIDSAVRMAAFIAQIGHESGQLRRLVENLNYDAKGLATIWPSRYRAANGNPNAKAVTLARRPEAIANDAYSGRNGNTQADDGWRYRGRGLIQLTGRNNYRTAGEGLGVPLEDEPDLLEQPEHAALSAAWYWSTNKLSELADDGRFQDIGSLINTGKLGRMPHGAIERHALYQLGLKVLV